jgi:hypothetical protein
MKDINIQQSVQQLQQQIAVVNSLVEDLHAQGVRIDLAMKERNSNDIPVHIQLRSATQSINYLTYF